MNHKNLGIFSDEEVENVSNIFNMNYNFLKENKKYHKQLNRLDAIHSKLSKTLKNEHKKMFEEYDILIWENRDIELSLMYNVGIKKGLEMKNLKNH